MTVTAEVIASCTVSANPLAFGNYSLAQIDQTTTLSVTCTNGTPYSISLDAGAGAGATTAVRKMTSGADTLDYSLYKE